MMLAWLNRNDELVGVVAVPTLLLALDVAVRWGFGLSLEDTVPDMALIAAAGFFGLAAVPGTATSVPARSVAIALTLAAILLWIVSLGVLARWGTMSLTVGVPALAFYVWVLSEYFQPVEEQDD